MATIYLSHPKHGAKVAISPDEAALDIKNGWSVFDPSTPKAAPEAPEAPVVNALPTRRARTRKVEPQEE